MTIRLASTARSVCRAPTGVARRVGLIAAVLALYAPVPLIGQATGASPVGGADEFEGVDLCAGPESHAFDFWPGEWEVESRRLASGGAWHESRLTVRVETVLGGCAFVDYIDGAPSGEPIRGMGSRFWDSEAEEWVVTWLSTESAGRLEVWRGTFDADGRGEFLQEVETAEGTLLSRLSWWDIEDDRAEWAHAISSDGGESWENTWTMRLRKVSEEERR
ncbi:MAG: hypothetical protein ACODAE_05925 [Gemmatimonadota bacterium]